MSAADPGYLPYHSESLTDLYSLIMFESPEIPAHLNAEAQDLLRQLLTTSPDARPNLEAVL